MKVNHYTAIQKITSSMTHNAQIEKQVEMQNWANANSVGYVPQSVDFKHVYDNKTNLQMPKFNKIKIHPEQTQSVSDPDHPLASEEGMVTKPINNSIMTVMKLQEINHQLDLSLKLTEANNEMESKTIAMIGH